MHVLLVEDAPDLLLLLRIILGREPDLDITTCGNNFSTVYERTDWSNIDVAVVDQFLGTYDGKDLLRRLAREQPHVRRIMLTADVSVTREEAEADLVLTKPIDGRALAQAVRSD